MTRPAGAGVRGADRGRAGDAHAESEAWVQALRGQPAVREEAAARLHALLLAAARYEIARRQSSLSGVSSEPLDDLATQCADDALVAVLRKLDDFRFESRFSTWAYKFAILEAAVRCRRRAWQERELPVDPEAWTSLPAGVLDPVDAVVGRERLREILEAIRTELSPHQREVICALVLAQVPLDVLAERLGSTRGALYKTLHDARARLRAATGEEAA
jgi:RNA polymerase sigma-70 factor (ECF subfamily)